MVGTDDSDQQYSAITDFYVDNTPPKFTTALDGQGSWRCPTAPRSTP
ncbi:MAG: hypothetical protein IPP00_03050 [Actinomycetales bacterium]|uniref:Uncharacterized protein n=1 Tax=Candidatus Phosphoribacter hodrii TaxID=2953743 RepID=A0A9D7Y0M3_9MICO|nr:hypothetical protein [Candidatus Phosphoribacter hodrii]